MMRGALLLASLMVASTAGWSAEPEPEPLDAAFLEYLANLEGDDDDWTLLAEAGQKSATQPESETPPETPKAGKPGKEAAKQAAEDR